MYKTGGVVVLLIHRLKEDKTTAIGIVEEVEENGRELLKILFEGKKI